MLRRSALFAAALALVACGGSGPSTAHPTGGNPVVKLKDNPAQMTITTPGGSPLIAGLPGGAAGTTDPPNVAFAFRHADAKYTMTGGIFDIEESNAGHWSGVTQFTNVQKKGDETDFTLTGADGSALGTGSVSVDAGNVTWSIIGDSKFNRASMAFSCSATDHFIGFGGQSYDVDERGQVVPIWVSEDGITKSDTNSPGQYWPISGTRHTTHTPMPIYLSNRGYALLLDTPYYSKFDMCATDESVVRVEAWTHRMDFTLFYGPKPTQAIERLTAHVGRPALPPKFTFAPWLDAIFGSANVRSIAKMLRDDGVPSSVIWTEDWRGGNTSALGGYGLLENWNVDRTLYPDFEQLAKDLHAEGFKFLTYENTFLDSSADIYQEALQKGVEIKTAAGKEYTFTGIAIDPSSMVDLTSPAAVTWTKNEYASGMALGSDGFMSDFGEWLPTDAVLASGESAEEFHNMYPVAYAKMNHELFTKLHAQDGVDRMYFMRSAYVGSQPNVMVMWGGDQQTDFDPGDGFPSVIPIGLGLGVTGFPYYGSDIAGYMSVFSEPSTKELWFRWASLGALSPVMRTHHGRHVEPTDEAGFVQNWNWHASPDTIQHFKRWATLHMQLFPYLYGMAEIAVDHGTPIMRPLALAYPDWDPGWTMTDEYMLGDRIIVAPVVTEGATSRTVQLPGGTFYPLLGGAAVTTPSGGGSITVPAPITECPAFVPAGTVLVLLPPTVQTAVDATPASSVPSLDAAHDDRVIWLWPGGKSDFTEQNGLSYSWTASGLGDQPSSAKWNGASVAIKNDSVSVKGPGTLTVDGGAGKLVVTGGAADRALTIVFH
jgi:sulfoquinovosidase